MKRGGGDQLPRSTDHQFTAEDRIHNILDVSSHILSLAEPHVTIPYFSSRKRCKRKGKAAESSCQVRILHLVLRSIDRTQLITAYQPSTRSGRRASSNGEVLETCTILTTKPNLLVADVHDRMPVILRQEAYELWLDPGVTNPTLVAECLKPFHSGLMKKYPVSTRVNRTENDGPDCALEVPIAATAQTLF